MSVHNFRLICPTHVCLSHGKICDQCRGGREYYCILKNCRGNLAESFVFAFHHLVARKTRLFKDNVTLFIAPSNFVKNFLIKHSMDKSQICVLPHMVPPPICHGNTVTDRYVAYCGRLTHEKGIHILVAAAKLLPQIQFLLTGILSHMPSTIKNIPNNIRCVGWQNRIELADLYRNARLTVIPSICFETFGLVAIEAMSYGLPVIASRLGALQEIVDDGITGLLFEPGNVLDLVSKIQLLWDNPALCSELGAAAREKALSAYSEQLYFERLIGIYSTAIEKKVKCETR